MDAYSKSENVYVCPRSLGSIFQALPKVLAVISLQLLQHRIPLAHNCTGTPYLSPLPLQSFPPIPCVGKNRCRLKWRFLHAVRINPFLSFHPSSSCDFLHHGSFGSATEAALASLHAHPLVLPHLLNALISHALGSI